MRSSTILIAGLFGVLGGGAMLESARDRGFAAGASEPRPFTFAAGPLLRLDPPIVTVKDVPAVTVEAPSNAAANATYVAAVTVPEPRDSETQPLPGQYVVPDVTSARVTVQLPNGRTVTVQCGTGPDSRDCLNKVADVLDPPSTLGATASAQAPAD